MICTRAVALESEARPASMLNSPSAFDTAPVAKARPIAALAAAARQTQRSASERSASSRRARTESAPEAR